MPKIVILVDMLEPLIDEQFDQSKPNSPMMEILVEFRISINIFTQFIIDLGIKPKHTMEVDRPIIFIKNPPPWTHQPLVRFGDWIYPPTHACNVASFDSILESTKCFKVVTSPKQTWVENGHGGWIYILVVE